MKAVDTQLVELSGRYLLISQLTAGGVEVAEPIRDRGIDLVAYLDRIADTPQFLACPIQLKANRGARFSLDRKYESVPNLLMVYVWGVHDPSSAVVHALTYKGAFKLLKEQGHTESKSWEDDGLYTLTVNEAWRTRLAPFRMTAEKWPELIRSTVGRS